MVEIFSAVLVMAFGLILAVSLSFILSIASVICGDLPFSWAGTAKDILDDTAFYGLIVPITGASLFAGLSLLSGLF